MFLRIAGARSAEQSGIRGVKRSEVRQLTMFQCPVCLCPTMQANRASALHGDKFAEVFLYIILQIKRINQKEIHNSQNYKT